MAPQASEKCGHLLLDHQQIGCCASNSIDSGQVLRRISIKRGKVSDLHFQYQFHDHKEDTKKLDAVHTKYGGGNVKTRTYFLVACLMLVGLFFMTDPAAAIDTSTHSENSTCTTHLPATITGPNFTFTFCQAGSAATSWSAEIRNSANGLIATCNPNPLAWTSIPPPNQQIVCTNLPFGTIKTKVFWYVGGSPLMDHPDTTLRR